MNNRLLPFLLLLTLPGLPVIGQTNAPLKQHSAFFNPERLARIQANTRNDPWAAELRDRIVANARPWLELSDDELWDLVFGATISRSWMVWSNGHCPACRKPVEMYRWKMDAWKHPWKVGCPECVELFPKNDFYAFYRSGLDEHGVFNPALADRKLLFNTDHPDPADPLHPFGVDDGEGYTADGKRWRFIGAYLIFGQFHQKILSGIDTLAAAYVMTGDTRYSRKACILLDRVADVYPTFDYAKQGLVYETRGHNGYISVWHDTSEETYEMALAYDQMFEGLRDDAGLIEFLSAKAKAHQLENPKLTFADIQRNIEGRILRDALAHPQKIHSNFPRRECTEAAIHTVLGWPENRAHVEKLIDQFVSKATAVDGVTGEKGLAGYSAYTIAAMARFLNEYVRSDPAFLAAVMQRNPGLRQTYRFHIDTHCLQRYYPLLGDTGSFGKPMPRNPILLYSRFGATTSQRSPLAPSMYSLYWQLYRETGDPAYVQALYRENGHSVKNLPYDIFEEDPEAVRKNSAGIIEKHGEEPALGCINKQQWRLAILRSGRGENARAVSLDYDAGGAHGHFDGMTLGLFAQGLDLLPDFGYPPVQFGGWQTPRANWYKMTASHNTVMVDRRDQAAGAGQTTLWAEGNEFKAVRASAPGLIGGKQFERTIALIDTSPEEFYVFDIFRVAGGSEHAKFVHGVSGKLETRGLASRPVTNDYTSAFQLRDFQADTNASPGWGLTWTVDDIYQVLSNRTTVRMNYTDLSTGVEAITATAWIAPAYYTRNESELWNPCAIIRRRGAPPLASTFVSVLEPFAKQSAVKSMRRLPLRNSAGEILSDAQVAIELELADGRSDLIIASDTGNPLNLTRPGEDGRLIQPDWNVELNGDLVWLRRDKRGRPTQASICNGVSLKTGKTEINLPGKTDFAEFRFKSGRAIRVQ